MKRYNGNAMVPGGYYLNLASWSLSAVSGKEGRLEGSVYERHLRLPLPVMLVVGAALSLGYCIFLPFIGFALLVQTIARKLAGLGHRAVAATVSSVAPAWLPGEAHFTGDPQEGMGELKTGAHAAGQGESQQSEGLGDLQDEIARKRSGAQSTR